MDLSEKLTAIFNQLDRCSIPREEIIKEAKIITLLEISHRVIAAGLILELTLKDIIASLKIMSKKFGQPLTIQDVQTVIQTELQNEGKYTREEAIQKAKELIADKGVMESLFLELRKLNIPIIQPKA